MCCIFLLLNSLRDMNFINDQFNKGKNRGPEFSILKNIDNMYMGFHRLAINGLDSISNQPIVIDDLVLICNGEIYNHKLLEKNNNFNMTTNSDCEIIIHMYQKYGIDFTLKSLDGVFSFALYDKSQTKLFIARDPLGIRPLYWSHSTTNDGTLNLALASELKMLTCFDYDVEQYQPGHYSIINLDPNVDDKINTIKYYDHTNIIPYNAMHAEHLYDIISDSLVQAVKKRIENTDRKVACLLSGGLDSSLITSLVAHMIGAQNLETYSIGMEGSPDLKYAKIVADFLGTKHNEVILSEDDFFNAIPEVIYAVESYDTTTIRASVGNYLVAKHISQHSDAKVIFNGDGSDELCSGYLYFHHAPSSLESHKENVRLIKEIHMYDVLRADRGIAGNGLEARVPFLDSNFIQTYLSIQYDLRIPREGMEKWLLRKSFEGYLPEEVLWRRKEAFSDGVSSMKRSWHHIL